MLQNAYFLARIGADTAENEQHFAGTGIVESGGGEARERHAPRHLPAESKTNAFSKNAFFENFANLWRARSRLYQNEILQENMRSTAFFKLYKICILLHRCNLKIFRKIGLKKQQKTSFAPIFSLKISAKNRQYFFRD